MIVRQPCEIPAEMREVIRGAVRLEWWTLGFLTTIAVAMYFTLGSSQAMKTAWVEDLLSMIPPVLFLISIRIHDERPSARFPYGKRRVVMIAFLGAALTLLALGGYMLLDALMKLAMREHPTIGTKVVFGHQLWLGWLMIAALLYSIVPPVVLGHLKKKPAHALHEKTLSADADMNKADWMTAVAAILGVLGIGAGLWWADSVAAALISADIAWDGAKNTKSAVQDLIDRRPSTIEGDERDPIYDRLREVLLGLDWVRDADLRLRDEGHVVAGEAYVVPADGRDLLDRLAQTESALRDADWRVCDVVAVPLTAEAFARRRAREADEPGAERS